MGKDDVQESLEVSPYGIDSNPIKDMVALYSPTAEIGVNVVIGYVNKNKIADIGEFRVFSTDDKGEVKSYIHLKNDGVIQINGDNDNAVRYSELKKGFDSLKSDFNKLVNAFNSHVHATAAVGPPVPPTPIPSVIPAKTSLASIDKSKIDDIKTS